MSCIRAIDVVSVIVGVAVVCVAFTAPNILDHNIRITVICGIICMIPTAIRLSEAFTIPLFLHFLIVLLAFLHVFGLAINIYVKGGYYDTVTHTLSQMTVSISIFLVLACFQHYTHGTVNFSEKGITLFAAILGMTFSVYWEVIEYCSDMLIGYVTQYSPYDTLTDLVCDFLGNIITSVFVGFYMTCHSPQDLVESFGLNPRIKKLAFANRPLKA